MNRELNFYPHVNLTRSSTFGVRDWIPFKSEAMDEGQEVATDDPKFGLRRFKQIDFDNLLTLQRGLGTAVPEREWQIFCSF